MRTESDGSVKPSRSRLPDPHVERKSPEPRLSPTSASRGWRCRGRCCGSDTGAQPVRRPRRAGRSRRRAALGRSRRSTAAGRRAADGVGLAARTCSGTRSRLPNTSPWQLCMPCVAISACPRHCSPERIWGAAIRWRRSCSGRGAMSASTSRSARSSRAGIFMASARSQGQGSPSRSAPTDRPGRWLAACHHRSRESRRTRTCQSKSRRGPRSGRRFSSPRNGPRSSTWVSRALPFSRSCWAGRTRWTIAVAQRCRSCLRGPASRREYESRGIGSTARPRTYPALVTASPETMAPARNSGRWSLVQAAARR